MTAPRDRETVVLVHGLWMKGWCMALLAWRLRRSGFETRCFSYRSMGSGLRENAARLRDYLAALSPGMVHLVGHSLGCIVIRALFHYFPSQQPGRIVMLTPPNQGSAVAEQLARSGLGRTILGKSVQELIAGVPKHWTVPVREIGIISGTVPLGLGRLFAKLSTPHDGVVTVEETALPGACAQLMLPVAHTGALVTAQVARTIAHFLRHGRFD